MKMLAITVHLREDWEYSIICKQFIFNSSCEFNSLISYKNFAEEINDDMDWPAQLTMGVQITIICYALSLVLKLSVNFRKSPVNSALIVNILCYYKYLISYSIFALRVRL